MRQHHIINRVTRSDRRSWWLSVTAAAVTGTVIVLAFALAGRRHASSFAPVVTTISYEDARTTLAAFRTHLPEPLAGRTDSGLEARWPTWVRERDTAIRDRVTTGQDESIVNMWLFGTSFTSHPRATAQALLGLSLAQRTALLQARLDDLLAALATPGVNERLLIAQHTLRRQGIDVNTRLGYGDAARHLAGTWQRMMGELQRLQSESSSARTSDDDYAALDAYESYYRHRGLSSDTSILASYSVERALETAVQLRMRRTASIRHVAVIGPGLDFVDKAEGHDFYPLQSIQSLALVDSLIRLGLADPAGVEVTAFDVSAPVIDHISRAQMRARGGEPYVMHLPLDFDEPSHTWRPELIAYWQRLGNWIGTEVRAIPSPEAEAVRVRAVRVSPGVVQALGAKDLNIVLQRPVGSPRFDLVVATNILVYYEPFEQALSLANIAAMLEPGGLFLTNSPVWPLATTGLSPGSPVTVDYDRQQGGDTLYWFRRAAVDR